MLKRFTKSLASVSYENPQEGWRLFLILAGALITFVIGMIIYGFVGIFEKITGKDYLNSHLKEKV